MRERKRKRDEDIGRERENKRERKKRKRREGIEREENFPCMSTKIAEKSVWSLNLGEK